MTSRVNPPPEPRIPTEFLQDNEKRSYFQQFQFIIFQLWKRTGGAVDLVEQSSQPRVIQSARITDLELRVGSGDFFTSDETGFTVDSTLFTADMVEV